MTDTKIAKPATKRPRKMAREPKSELQSAAAAAVPSTTASTAVASVAPSPVTKKPTKAAVVLGLLSRPTGATINHLIAATGWLPHTTRAALTGLKKKGYVIVSEKKDGVRNYRIDGGAA